MNHHRQLAAILLLDPPPANGRDLRRANRMIGERELPALPPCVLSQSQFPSHSGVSHSQSVSQSIGRWVSVASWTQIKTLTVEDFKLRATEREKYIYVYLCVDVCRKNIHQPSSRRSKYTHRANSYEFAAAAACVRHSSDK